MREKPTWRWYYVRGFHEAGYVKISFASWLIFRLKANRYLVEHLFITNGYKIISRIFIINLKEILCYNYNMYVEKILAYHIN